MDIKRLEGKIPKHVYDEIPNIIKTFKINTSLRLAHFLAQCAHESGGFKAVRENLNYSANALRRVFGKYFPTQDLANKYARNPQMIGSRVYANRMGNGDENSKEGYYYRGRGYIQLTGKDNYRLLSNDLGLGVELVMYPDKVATEYPLMSAAWFFNKNNIIKLSDKGSDINTIKSVTKRVNGGYNGLQDRIKYFNYFYNLLK